MRITSSFSLSGRIKFVVLDSVIIHTLYQSIEIESHHIFFHHDTINKYQEPISHGLVGVVWCSGRELDWKSRGSNLDRCTVIFPPPL